MGAAVSVHEPILALVVLRCPTVIWVYGDSTLSRGNLVETHRQTSTGAAKCKTSKLSQRGWENEWLNTPSPPHPHSCSPFLLTLTLPPLQSPTPPLTFLAHAPLQSQHCTSHSVPKCPDIHTFVSPPAHTHTHPNSPTQMQTYTSTPPVNQWRKVSQTNLERYWRLKWSKSCFITPQWI